MLYSEFKQITIIQSSEEAAKKSLTAKVEKLISEAPIEFGKFCLNVEKFESLATKSSLFKLEVQYYLDEHLRPTEDGMFILDNLVGLMFSTREDAYKEVLKHSMLVTIRRDNREER